MYDILNTKCVCGGTFKEVNIYEDIECNNCGEASDRYIYDHKETVTMLENENRRLNDRILELQNVLKTIRDIAYEG